MADKDKKDWLNDEVFDALLKQAMAQQLKEEMEECEAMAEAEDLAPSADFDARIEKIAAKYRAKEKAPKRRKIAMWAAVFLLVLIGTHFTLYFSVEAYRLPFQELYLNLIGKGTEITTAPESEEDTLPLTSPQDICPIELWVPDGYTLDFMDENNSESAMFYTWHNEDDEEISLHIMLHSNNELEIDTHPTLVKGSDGEDAREILVGDTPGYLFQKQYEDSIEYDIVWSDVNYIFTLSSTFSADEKGKELLLKMAESVQEKN